MSCPFLYIFFSANPLLTPLLNLSLPVSHSQLSPSCMFFCPPYYMLFCPPYLHSFFVHLTEDRENVYNSSNYANAIYSDDGGVSWHLGGHIPYGTDPSGWTIHSNEAMVRFTWWFSLDITPCQNRPSSRAMTNHFLNTYPCISFKHRVRHRGISTNSLPVKYLKRGSKVKHSFVMHSFSNR